MTAPRTRWWRTPDGETRLAHYFPHVHEHVWGTVWQDGSRWVATVHAPREVITRYAKSERAAKRRAVLEARRLGGVR
jgi:hypothetical protein